MRINPELAFRHNGTTTFYKLHLTQLPLRSDGLDTIFQMFGESISESGNENMVLADLRRGRVLLLPPSIPNPRMGLALQMDAEQFIRTWHVV